MSSAFERLQQKANEKKAKLELVPSGKPQLAKVVNHLENIVVNRTSDITFTTVPNLVNKPTTELENENLLTTKTDGRGKQDEKFTTPEEVVNQNKRNWSTTERKRGNYGGTVESFRTSEDFRQKIKVYCAENKIDKQDFYRIVVNHYFDTVVNHAKPNAVNLSTDDDLRLMTLYKTKPLIINLYLRYNSIFNEKTKWTVRDDDAGRKVNDLDIKIIELGIIQTQANKRYEGKINSFSYYLPEIGNFSELNMSDEILKTMLEVNRKRWQQQTGKSLNLDFLNDE